jgi:WD40 repeat protein
VTSIDWKQTKSQGEVFVSCSDDDTIRVYQKKDQVYKGEGDLMELKMILNTYFINDWHTLTYMCLEDEGDRLAAVTENGYLIVWDLNKSLETKT